MSDLPIDAIARDMWLSDMDADPMFHKSYEASKADYRRLAEVAVARLLRELDGVA